MAQTSVCRKKKNGKENRIFEHNFFDLNFEWFLARRLSIAKLDKNNISRPITQIAKATIAVSVMVMLVSVSTGIGFQKKVKEKLASYNGHIQISSFENYNTLETNPIPKNQVFYIHPDSLPNVKHIQVYGNKAGIIRTDTEFEGVVLKGVSEDYDWSFFEDYLLKGTIPKFKEGIREDSVLLSKNIADDLSLSVSDKFNMFFLSQGKRPRARSFIVSGIFQTGVNEFDTNFLIGDLDQVRRLNNWDSTQVGGFELILNDLDKLDESQEDIFHRIGYKLNAVSLKQANKEIIGWLNLFDNNIAIILGIMILVSVVNMITILFILILERTHLIGLLKALGAKNWNIRKVFIYKAIILLGRGLFWGNCIGIGLLLMQYYFRFITLDPESYYMTYAPVDIHLGNILLINLGTVFISLLMLIGPSYYISKISPARTIKFN